MLEQRLDQHLGLDWKTVKAIDKHFLERDYGQPDYQGLRILAVDEISIRKGHRYLTVVLDYLTGRVVFVGKDRKAKTLERFLETQRQSGKVFSDTAMWTVATSLAYFESCLAVHEGESVVELTGDEDQQIEQLLDLTAEYAVREEMQVIAADEFDEEVESAPAADVIEEPDETEAATDAKKDEPSETGSEPVGDSYSPDDAAASFYRTLGIDHLKEYHTPDGRPVMVVGNGTPIKKLWG